jgi:hypothetical protein
MEGFNFDLQIGPGEWAVIILCVLVGLFFLVGNWVNNRISQQTILWLRKGLSVFGEVTQLRFSMPTSTGIAIKAAFAENSHPPGLEGNLILEHRENLPYWLFQLLQGRRDTLELFLKNPDRRPSQIQIYHDQEIPKDLVSGKLDKNRPILALQQYGFSFFTQGEADPRLLIQLTNLLQRFPDSITQITVQPKAPHLVFKTRLASLIRSEPEVFFKHIQSLLD